MLASAEGRSDLTGAGRLGITRATAGKCRWRFVRAGCAGLLDEPRKVSDNAVEQVLARTLESLPRGATQWSRRSMASAWGLSPSTIGRIWRAFGLRPRHI